MTTLERELLYRAARNRNAFVRSAAKAYEQTGTVSGHLLTAHRRNVEATIYAHYRRVLPFFATLAENQVALKKGFRPRERKDRFRHAAQEWIAREALRKATMIADTDRDDVLKEIDQGFAGGLGTEEIARNIRKVTELTPFRAATVARTETHAAATYGSVTAARGMEDELGLKLKKEWLATKDVRTRPEHLAADGQQVALDEQFSVGGELMDRPGDPSASPASILNCRCALAFSEGE